MSEMKRFYKVERPDVCTGSGWTSPDLQTVIDAEFDGIEVGGIVKITVVEMTQAEFDALPEFEGW